ncbi:MAG: class I SAM-dependent methyltransferase [Gammaproteobacteria bacterium]
MTRLETRKIEDTAQIREFFDEIAADYREAHGPARKLLDYRLSVIKSLLENRGGTLLEIGCGSGAHLFELASDYTSAAGCDLSPKMIERAEKLRRKRKDAAKFSFAEDPAEELSTVAGGSVDSVLCVGALEHMPDKEAVFRQVLRVLKPGGEFVCLTPNGGYVWYGFLALLLGLDAKHLSSDRFMTAGELREGLAAAGLETAAAGCWTFVPGGDMPAWLCRSLVFLDGVGRLLNIPAFRGGIYVRALKAAAPEYRDFG